MGELAKEKERVRRSWRKHWRHVKQRGYGVVTPTKEEIVLEEPQIVKTWK